VVKSVGRPADIYSLGALFYYLISGAYANPKNLFDAFRKFVEYEKRDETNSSPRTSTTSTARSRTCAPPRSTARAPTSSRPRIASSPTSTTSTATAS
jgi:hypothetical protein